MFLLNPWRVVSVVLLRKVIVRFIKRPKTSSRGLRWRFRNSRLPSDFNVEVDIEDRNQSHVHGFQTHIILPSKLFDFREIQGFDV